jgi:hypothetical protein
MDSAPVYLPVEILDRIIWFTIPDHNYLAYPATHSTTKTLLALLTVSRATSRAAKPLLYTHCLYVDTPWRLDSLLTASLARSDSPISMSCIHSLYLAPFPGRTIRDRKIISQITELFTLLGPSLKRLVINMPLRSHYPIEDTIERLRPILREGFEQLVHLEEFSSVKDELYLAYWNPEAYEIPEADLDPELGSDLYERHLEHWLDDFMFERWPKLRCLALYNRMLQYSFRQAIGRMPMLERVVLSRPDVDEGFFDGTWPWYMSCYRDWMRITLVEATDDASHAGTRKMTFENLASDKQPNAWKYKLFVDKEEDPIFSVQDWTLQRMLDGSIWSLSDHTRLEGEDQI